MLFRSSSQIMKRAGIGLGLEEAETVMTELDDQMREASELTSVFATPFAAGVGEDSFDIDVDAELGIIQAEAAGGEPPLALPAPPTQAPRGNVPTTVQRMVMADF